MRASLASIALLALAVAAPAGPVLTDTDPAPAGNPAAAKGIPPYTIRTITFDSQLPAEPGTFDSPLSGFCNPGTGGQSYPISPRSIRIVEPPVVDGTTGLLVVLGGINGDDCRFGTVFDNPGADAEFQAWPSQKNVIFAHVFYRNISYYPPYDFGKYQVVDVLRGVGALLEEFPQIDRRRIYVFGGSGGGHVALQTVLAARHLFAEVYASAPITRITTSVDVAMNGYAGDANNFAAGWNTNLGFPVAKPPAMPEATFDRYLAERALRSPQENFRRDAPTGPRTPLIGVVHGTADATTVFRHFLDLRAAVEDHAQGPAVQTSADTWQVANIVFAQVPGAGHGSGGPSDRNTRARQINYYFPDAFTSRRASPPELHVSYRFSPQAGNWRWRVEGETLATVELVVEQLPEASGAANWSQYR